MNKQLQPPIKTELKLFFTLVAFLGLGMGMSDSVISNFFKDAYNVTAVQRGFLEFPREFPGILCFLIISFTSSFGDVRLAIIAQTLSAMGAMALGLFTPSFGVMSLFIFLHSMGNHLYMPLHDSIGMSIIGKQNLGKRMGQAGGIRTAFAMLSSLIIFIGFKTGFFSFKTHIKLPFIIGSMGFLCIVALYILLYSKYKVRGEPRKKKFQIIIRKKYSIYYGLTILTGVHRQIMIVFGPWVLIEILRQQADTFALLGIISSFIGIFLIPVVGHWIDRFGPKIILLMEGLVFIAVYTSYGLMSSAFTTGSLARVGIPVIAICGLYIFERMTMQLGIVRAVYLKSIALDPADITPTLSIGLSMDHVVSVTCAYLGGLTWYNFGPQYVFFLAAGISILNVIFALMIKSGGINAPHNQPDQNSQVIAEK